MPTLRAVYSKYFLDLLSSAAVAQLPEGWACYAQRCSSAYHCCNVWLFALLSPLSFDQSNPSPLTSLINNMFLPTELLLTGFFCFLHHSLQTVETIVRENHRRSAVSEILKPPCLAPTIIPCSKSLETTFLPNSDIWSEKTTEPLDLACFYALRCSNMID